MNSSKLKEIIKFSLNKNIQNKWFIIFNVITLISVIILLNWSSIATLFNNNSENDPFKLAILDNSNLIYNDFVNILESNTTDNKENIVPNENSISDNNITNNAKNNINSENNPIYDLPTNFISTTNYDVEKITENTYNAENIPDNFAIIEIIPDDIEGFKTSIISKEGIENTIYTPVKNTLYDCRNKILSQKYNINNTTLEIFQSDLSINRIMLGVDAEDSSTKEIIKIFSSVFTYMVTILIFSKLANEIAQEKQSKSSEYILTTVSAKEYLFAKIFSNIVVLLIQGLLLLVYYLIAISLTNIINIATTDLTLSTGIISSALSIDIVVYILSLIVYNVLNLILLCIIQATLSAKTASTSEAGNTVSLLVFLMMAAYIVTLYIITPYTKVSTLLYIISCIPLLSAYFVPAMMVVGQAATWQIIVSLTILIIAIPITFNFCAKIFKNGILDYTKLKNKKDNKIKSENKQEIFWAKRSMKNIGFVTGIAILINIGLQSLLSLIGGLILPSILNENFTQTDITLILQMILQIISLGLASAFVFTYCDNKDAKISKSAQKNNEKTNTKSNFINKLKIILITLLLIFGLQFLLSGIIYPKLGLDYDVTDMFEIDSDSSLLSKVIVVFALAVTPAIFEELFFRKAIIDFTLPHGKYFALLFSSLLFGLLHMNLSQGLFAFLIGLIFGIIYLYTKDIKLTMLIHFINNGFAAISLILPDFAFTFVSLLLIAVLLVGFVFLILTLLNKENRHKIINLFTHKLSLSSLKSKYKYIFFDFIFDVSMVLILFMSILTETMLR